MPELVLQQWEVKVELYSGFVRDIHARNVLYKRSMSLTASPEITDDHDGLGAQVRIARMCSVKICIISAA